MVIYYHKKNLEYYTLFCSMTGADISNIVNQAAFQAARAGETEVNMGHLEYAKEKIRDG